jgi:predicted ATPase with chaperone activity
MMPSPATCAALQVWICPRTPARVRFCYNPCPCGYYGDPVKECTCSSAMVTRYQKRISGPLLDRIDIHVEVPRVEYEKLSDDRLG